MFQKESIASEQDPFRNDVVQYITDLKEPLV
jgi:hypothetical protein